MTNNRFFAQLLVPILLSTPSFGALSAPDLEENPFSTSPCGGFDGFYMGANFGFLYETIKLAYNENPDSYLTKTDKYGTVGGTYLGYLREIGASRVMIGLETNFIVANTQFKVNVGPNSSDTYALAKFFRQTSAGITPIIGKLFNSKTFLFVKAGAEKIFYKVDFNYNNDPATPAALQGTLKTAKPKITGLIIGVGVDYLATPQIAVGAEWNYSGLFLKFKSFTISGTGDTQSISLKRYENKVMLRASYRFG